MLITGLAVAACSGDGDSACESAGRVFPDGSGWTCADGCNGCSCDGGEITMTAALCTGPPGPAANMLTCLDGVEHRHGDSWECSDGCGTCGCDDGVITRDDCGAAGAGAGAGE